MSGLLNIGLQALNVSQRALDATGQNIANVNTPGYSRQGLVLASRALPEQGVKLVDVARITDSFATRQLWSDTSSYQSSTVFEQYASRLDDLLASEETSVSAAMDLFFGALQTAIDDPASIPNRELFLAQSEATARRFNDLDRLISQQADNINAQISTQASQMDQMLGRIAELNDKIKFSAARDEPANELKDQRDELVRQVSEIAGVSVQSNGDDDAINLFIGNGQPLVVGNLASRVSVKDGDPDPVDKRLVVEVSGNEIEVGGQVTSGTIGGLLQFREQVLEPAANELGRLAIVFADTLNTVQREGMDLDGNLGANLFGDLSGSGVVRGSKNNQTNLNASHSLTVTDPSALQASDYSLKFSASDQLTIVRQSDGARFTLADFTEVGAGTFADQPMTYEQDFANGQLSLNIDGVTLNLNGTSPYAKGDQFLMKPVSNGAEDISVALTSGRELAFASPLRAESANDNQGSVQIQSVSVTDISDPSFAATPGQLTPPAEIVFNADGSLSIFDITNPSNPTPYQIGGVDQLNLPYTSGQPIQLNGFSVTLEGVPTPGDRFSIDYNTDGVSDNSNALAMSTLQQANTVGGASYQDTYGRLVESVGTKASVAKINAAANESVLASTTAVRDGVSGVNLDEEAANIIRFQQTYQAASQLIAASRTLFDTLLRVAGG